jgi:hypothetical protein
LVFKLARKGSDEGIDSEPIGANDFATISGGKDPFVGQVDSYRQLSGQRLIRVAGNAF